jgi:hypothetical protein
MQPAYDSAPTPIVTLLLGASTPGHVAPLLGIAVESAGSAAVRL